MRHAWQYQNYHRNQTLKATPQNKQPSMVGKQKMVMMIHMIRAFYSIRATTNTYNGNILGFVRDYRATKEPTLVCLLQTKA
jgi:hypothetical protein